MDFFEVVKSRRSIRKFKEDHVSDDDILKCIEAASLAPSASNSQPWKFLIVRDSAMRLGLSEAGYNQSCLTTAPVITVILGDKSRYKKRLRRAKELADIGAVDKKVLESAPYRSRVGDIKSNDQNSIVLNAVLAAEHYVLAAAALGLGTCWVMLFDFDKVVRAISSSDDCFPIALIPTGYPDEAPLARPRYPLCDIFSFDHFHTEDEKHDR